MFWTALGVGALINTPGNTGYRGAAKVRRGPRQRMRSLSEALTKLSVANWQGQASDVELSTEIDLGLPPFPQHCYDQLAQMQLEHCRVRQTFADELREELYAFKEEYFASHHYQTELAGHAPRVRQDESGLAQIEEGAETPSQNLARSLYENSCCQTLSITHDSQREQFLRRAGDSFEEALRQGWNELAEPQQQRQLVQLAQRIQSEAFALLQRQDDELWLCDLPVCGFSNEVKAKLEAFREQEQALASQECDCPQLAELVEYEFAVCGLMRERKMALLEQQLDRAYLLDLRRLSSNVSVQADFAEILPGFLTNIIHNMGVYSINWEQACAASE